MNEEIKYIEPFKTIEEIELAVSQLDDWTKPGELYKYLEILYRLTAFYGTYKFDVENYDGLKGQFVGHYSGSILGAAREICSSKFPGSEIWDETNRLKPGIPLVVNYLGNYMTGGMSVIMERSDFTYRFTETYRCKLKQQTKEEIIRIEASAKEYMQTKSHKK